MSQSMSVSELTFQLKTLVENSFSTLSIHGEISGLRLSSKGTLFFTLKDEWSSITIIFFSHTALSIQPENGMQVTITGTLSLYAKQGTYSIVGKTLKPLGRGNILAKLLALKETLSHEGVFDPEHKPPIPALPRRIAVITSTQGAAVKDISLVLSRSPIGLHILIIPVAVQGQDAAASIHRAITHAAREKPDLILLSRGGGSFEDLLPFSDEQVVRAVATSQIPVITAVGHEIDEVLCDFASSHTAATPTAGAQFIINTISATLNQYYATIHFLERRIIALLQQSQEQLKTLPRLLDMHYTNHYQQSQTHCAQLKEQLHHAIQKKLTTARQSLDVFTPLLRCLSPAAVFSRGYAKIYRNQQVVRNITQLSAGDQVQLYLKDGVAEASVDETHEKEVLHDL